MLTFSLTNIPSEAAVTAIMITWPKHIPVSNLMRRGSWLLSFPSLLSERWFVILSDDPDDFIGCTLVV